MPTGLSDIGIWRIFICNCPTHDILEARVLLVQRMASEADLGRAISTEFERRGHVNGKCINETTESGVPGCQGAANVCRADA